MNIRCALLGHKYGQVVNPANKPKNWSHTLYCFHCGNTMAFVSTDCPTQPIADAASSGVGVSEETDTV